MDNMTDEMIAEGMDADDDATADLVADLQQQLTDDGFTRDEILDILASEYRIKDANRYLV